MSFWSGKIFVLFPWCFLPSVLFQEFLFIRYWTPWVNPPILSSSWKIISSSLSFTTSANWCYRFCHPPECEFCRDSSWPGLLPVSQHSPWLAVDSWYILLNKWILFQFLRASSCFLIISSYSIPSLFHRWGCPLLPFWQHWRLLKFPFSLCIASVSSKFLLSCWWFWSPLCTVNTSPECPFWGSPLLFSDRP